MRRDGLAGFIIAGSMLAGSMALAQEPVQPPEEKLICKKQLETGSLVKKRKMCMTKADWARVGNSQQEGSRRLVEQLTQRSVSN